MPNTTDLGIAKHYCETLIKQLDKLSKGQDLYADYEEILSVKILLEHYEELQKLNKEKSDKLQQLKDKLKTDLNSVRLKPCGEIVNVLEVTTADYAKELLNILEG